ncbi:putative type VI secretion system effector [Xanthomonas oryzae]|nr:putative type VI secretion system effector [Xanthomonas oryzae]AXM40658.1 hypothetical protein BRN51_16175 [Xanthomonas oryzae pv. oryzae]AZK85814.1 hypothetical protein BO993_00105 [Xanthomonas oryzae pv. oryzae]AZK89466.1 hypothetical protein BO993_23925 [Xanthomonas oryzae pv. oryzae]OLK18798.1 hypothetical protein IXO621_17810 [Xanthomonas oryzae pv. oryzae]OLK41579.1 hypothetical protein IXO620_18145 [Xanthomonas oryzae pv. oryzae]
MENKEPGQVLRGKIKNVKLTNTVAKVFFRAGDQERMTSTGVFAAALGESGLAAGMVAMSTEEMNDQVCLISFDIEDKHVDGLLWNWPFKEGDEVWAVVEKESSGNYICFAVLDPDERIISLYPHVSAGRGAHWRKTFKISAIVTMGFLAFMIAAASIIFFFAENAKIEIFLKGVGLAVLIALVASAWISYRIGRRFMPFVDMAEPIFALLGWNDVKNVDLRKITKSKKKPADPPAMGDSYFRY